jgi:hypothetical protein
MRLKPSKPTSWRPSAEATRLLQKLTAKLGLTQKGVLETAIRLLAKHENID